MARVKKLKIHPLANLVPEMSADAYGALLEDIRANGLREPIWVKGNEIVDGRTRYRACRELDIPIATREYEGDDVESFVISMNLARRHMTPQQRRWFIKRLAQLHPDLSPQMLADNAGMPRTTVRDCLKVVQVGDFANVPNSEALDVLTIVGKDGKRYPRRKQRQASGPVIAHRVTSLITKIDVESRRVAKWIAELHPKQLTDPDLFIQHLEAALQRFKELREQSLHTATAKEAT